MSNDDVKKDPCLSFIWKFDHFFEFLWELKMGKVFESPPFLVEGLHRCRWFLRIYTLKEDDSGDWYFNLHREWLEEESEPISIDFELAFLVDDDILLVTKRVEAHTFEKGDHYCWKGSDDFMDSYDRKTPLSEDTMSARCSIWKKDNELHESRICHARTHFEVERGTFTWCVKNFVTLQLEEIKKIHLATSSGKIPPTTLKLYLHGESTGEKFRLRATQFGTAHENVLLFNLQMTDENGPNSDFATFNTVFKKMDGLQVASCESFDSMADKDLHLFNNDLILKGTVLLFYGETQERVQYEPRYLSMNPSVISLTHRGNDPGERVSDFLNDTKADLQSLCKDPSDVNLVAGGKTFPAHKIILSARSPIFLAMFTSDMKEKTSDSVDIPDFGAETVQHVLKYLYTDTVEDLEWDGMSKLYEVADKYRLLSLKQKCSLSLKKKINTSNACDLLVFSDLHLDGDLKSFVQDFIMDNDREIMGMDK